MPIGIRQLRADLATQLRRAAAGESIEVSVDGRAVARLVPLDAGATGAPATTATWEELFARGALIAPRRHDGRWAQGSVATFATVRFDRLLAEIRG